MGDDERVFTGKSKIQPKVEEPVKVEVKPVEVKEVKEVKKDAKITKPKGYPKFK